MVEEEMQLTMPGGMADTVLFSPEPSRPLPGVLHLPDIGSIREAHREMARRLAAQGYAVLMPNPFYRTGPPPVFDFPRKMAEPRTMQRFAELVGPMTPEAQQRDVAAYVDLLAAQPAVGPGAVGVVGYCFSGALALRAAAARPGRRWRRQHRSMAVDCTKQTTRTARTWCCRKSGRGSTSVTRSKTGA
jgi:carboxymethylenebutenolidase